MKFIVIIIFSLGIFLNFPKISASTENIQSGTLIRVCEDDNEADVSSWLMNHYLKKDLPPNETKVELYSFMTYNFTEVSPIATFYTFLERITVYKDLKYLWAAGLIANKDSLEIIQETFNIADSSEAVVIELVHVEEDNAIREYVRVFVTNCKATGIEKANYIDIPKCGKKCPPQIFIDIFKNLMKPKQKTEGVLSILTWMSFEITCLYVMTTFILLIIAYATWKLNPFLLYYLGGALLYIV